MSISFTIVSNFLTEKVLFDVVDFKTTFNHILGRLTLKFMVMPNYAYSCLKIPMLNGAIMVRGCMKAVIGCDKKSLDMATKDLDRLED